MEYNTCTTEYTYNDGSINAYISETIEVCAFTPIAHDIFLFVLVLAYVAVAVKLVDFIKNVVIHFSS
jgi:hypothetical protein